MTTIVTGTVPALSWAPSPGLATCPSGYKVSEGNTSLIFLLQLHILQLREVR